MKIGVLCIHGFTGGPYEVQPFVDYLKMHTDWPVVVPTLPGHGITLNLANYSAESWMMEAELALRKLQNEVDRIIVVGFSMGGLIAMYLALRYPLSKLILLSAASRYISPRVLLDDVRKMIMESITKNHSPNTFYHLYNYKLTNTPFRSIIEFLRIVKMVEPYYGLISTPVCIVQGEKDEIVPFTSADELFGKIGSKKKEIIKSPNGKHHICYSEDCDDWFMKVLKFMQTDL